MESQKDDSSMTKPQREAGKKTGKILQCDCTVVTSVRINVS
jgi:hypothetical protein